MTTSFCAVAASDDYGKTHSRQCQVVADFGRAMILSHSRFPLPAAVLAPPPAAFYLYRLRMTMPHSDRWALRLILRFLSETSLLT